MADETRGCKRFDEGRKKVKQRMVGEETEIKRERKRKRIKGESTNESEAKWIIRERENEAG